MELLRSDAFGGLIVDIRYILDIFISAKFKSWDGYVIFIRLKQ